MKTLVNAATTRIVTLHTPDYSNVSIITNINDAQDDDVIVLDNIFNIDDTSSYTPSIIWITYMIGIIIYIICSLVT